MKKVMLWPDVYREQGHWLPAVNLAKSLQDENYEVEFMGIPDCEAIVSPYRATFHQVLGDIYPLGHSVDDKLEPIGQRWKPHHLLPMARGALDERFTGDEKPDLLVVGYFAGLEALILHHKYGIPLVVLTTYLRHPDEDPAIFAKGKLIYMPEPVVEKLIATATGNADMTMDEFVAPLESAPEMIPCPQEFDFFDDDWVHRDTVKYVEPMIERVPLSGDPLPENPPPASDGRDDVYHSIPTAEDAKIIFATSGSQVGDYEDKARRFFHSLIAMMKAQGMQGHHLVLAMGDKLLQEFRLEYGIDENSSTNTLPSNVSISAWVSQLEILRDAQVVFMHGGLATIKESIWEEVPIIIIPHGKDQDENALRIRRGGVGIVPDVDVITPQALRKFMTQATTSRWVKSRLSGMKALFEEMEDASPKASIQVISSVVAP